jgi:hypothetical protein
MWKKVVIMVALILSLFVITVSAADLCPCGCGDTIEDCRCDDHKG